MNLREAAQMALDALESWQKTCLDCGRPSEELGRATQPLQILRAALAQPEQEELGEIIPADEEQLNRIAKLVEQEPVAWMGIDIEGNPNKFRLNQFGAGIPLYTAPPQREWQGLTDEEIMKITGVTSADSDWNVTIVHKWIRAIEAKLRKKNFDRPS